MAKMSIELFVGEKADIAHENFFSETVFGELDIDIYYIV